MYSGGAGTKKKSTTVEKKDIEQKINKLHKFCNVIRYIEHEDEELYKVIYNLCMFPALGSKKGRGVTFLFPRDKRPNGFRSEIIRDAYSINIRNAYTMINSCVIQGFMNNLSDFQSANRIIDSNCNELKVVDVGDGTVTFSNGIKIEKDDNFQLLHPGAKYAVYNIVSGTPTLGKPKMSNSENMIGAYEGGAPEWLQNATNELKEDEYTHRAPGDKINIRNHILEIMYTQDGELLKKMKPFGVPLDLRLKVVEISDSLVTYLSRSENSDILDLVKDHMPANYFDMAYVIAWIIPTSVLEAWMKHDDSTNTNKVTLTDLYKSAQPDPKFAAVRNKIQAELLKTVDGTLYQKYIDLYEAFATKGTYSIGGVDYDFGDILSNVNMDLFKQRGKGASAGVRLLAHHECMHFTGKIIKNFKTHNIQDALQLIMAAKRVYLTGTQESLWTTNHDIFKTAVGAQYEVLCRLLDKLRSQNFMYIAGPSRGYATVNHPKMIVGGRPDLITPYNDIPGTLSFNEESMAASKF